MVKRTKRNDVENIGFSEMSIEQKKAIVESKDTGGFYAVVCPFCTLNRAVKPKSTNIKVRFDKFDIMNGSFIIFFRGGGRGSGFYKDETKSLTLDQAKDDPEFAELIPQIREQCKIFLEATGGEE